MVSSPTPTLYHVASGSSDEGWYSGPVELRPSRDLVSDPAGHPVIGRPEATSEWLATHPDVVAIDGRTSYRLFSVIAQFPAMRASWLRRIIGASQREVNDRLGRFVRAGLVAVYDRRYYLAELGMRRAANLSRVLPGIVRRRHGAYLDRWYRQHEQRHNDGVNLLVVRFAEERVSVVVGWRGEINVPDVTQVRPDLLAPVEEGPFGPGAYYLEFERSAAAPREVAHKLRPYRSRTIAKSGGSTVEAVDGLRWAEEAQVLARKGSDIPGQRHPRAATSQGSDIPGQRHPRAATSQGSDIRGGNHPSRRRAFSPVLTRVANTSPNPGRRSVCTSSSQLRSFT